MNCIQSKVCNCLRDCECDDGYSCCSEKASNGAKPTFGMCVKNGFCDEKRGIPVKNCKDDKQKSLYTQDSLEEYVRIREGYSQGDDCNCNEWKHAMVTMVVIVILLIFLGLIMYNRGN